MTELTTAATDALLALECLVVVVWMGRHAARRPRRARLWRPAFGLCGLAAGFGAVVHGLAPGMGGQPDHRNGPRR